jgi:hypothetical protein
MSESFLKIPDVDTMHRNCLQSQQVIGVLMQTNDEQKIGIYDAGVSWLLTDAYRRLGCLANSIMELSHYYLINRDHVSHDGIQVLKADVPIDD